MSPTKLSDEDKQEIVRSYRESQETTTSLAARFHVSSSTIGRILKTAFSPEEYNALVKQKRLHRGAASTVEKATSAPPPSSVVTEAVLKTGSVASEPKPLEDDAAVDAATTAQNLPLAVPQVASPGDGVKTESEAETSPTNTSDRHSWLDDAPTSNESVEDEGYDSPVASMWGEDCDSLDEDDWDDGSDDEEGTSIAGEEQETSVEIDIEILPLSAANFPRTCYLVIDRAGELVVKPLKEFQDLGRLPDAEFQQKTLVVFDNHKVARRYSNNRTQRVVKIPDGRLLYKTSFHLQGKGISRILMDGHVYALATLPQDELSRT
ncbi:MAG: transposase [Cyanobacteria bacterium J06641_5]